jgi:hypothetical protein
MANTLPMEGDQLPKFRKSLLNVLGMLNLVRSARTKNRELSYSRFRILDFGLRPLSRTSSSFHRLVQFIVTFDPSKVASLLVGGFPGEGSELLKGHRSF